MKKIVRTEVCYNCNGKGKKETTCFGNPQVIFCNICSSTGKIDFIEKIKRDKERDFKIPDWVVDPHMKEEKC
jgi:hypothetical protein